MREEKVEITGVPQAHRDSVLQILWAVRKACQNSSEHEGAHHFQIVGKRFKAITEDLILDIEFYVGEHSIGVIDCRFNVPEYSVMTDFNDRRNYLAEQIQDGSNRLADRAEGIHAQLLEISAFLDRFQQFTKMRLKDPKFFNTVPAAVEFTLCYGDSSWRLRVVVTEDWDDLSTIDRALAVNGQMKEQMIEYAKKGGSKGDIEFLRRMGIDVD